MLRQLFQTASIAIAKPYVRRELPGWGKIYDVIVGGYQRDWLWDGARTRLVRNKLNGYEVTVDLSRWAGRSYYFLGRWYDLETQLLLGKLVRKDDTIVDVGANRGDFTLAAAHLVGPGGRVISFEPQPGQFGILQDDLKRNGIRHVTVHRMGLGDRDATLTLHVPALNTGEASFGPLPYDLQTPIDVPVRVGDEVLGGETNPSFIKIDVEGFEARVMRGLRRTIARARPVIVTEVVDDHLERCGSSRAELFGILEDLGYRGYALGLRGTRKGPELTLSELTQDGRGTNVDAVWFPRERAVPSLV